MNPRAAAALRELTRDTDSTRPEREWHLLSAHGTVMFYIVYNQGCSIDDISNALYLTRRSVWGTIGDLRRAAMVVVHKEGRKHRYYANFDAQLRHPLFREGPCAVCSAASGPAQVTRLAVTVLMDPRASVTDFASYSLARIIP